MKHHMPTLVVDVTDFENFPSHLSGGVRLPERHRPTVMHRSREVAEHEAKRLASRFPGRVFLVLEAQILATTIKVPTHITLGGKVVAESQRATLVDLADDPDALPF